MAATERERRHPTEVPGRREIHAEGQCRPQEVASDLWTAAAIVATIARALPWRPPTGSSALALARISAAFESLIRGGEGDPRCPSVQTAGVRRTCGRPPRSSRRPRELCRGARPQGPPRLPSRGRSRLRTTASSSNHDSKAATSLAKASAVRFCEQPRASGTNGQEGGWSSEPTANLALSTAGRSGSPSSSNQRFESCGVTREGQRCAVL